MKVIKDINLLKADYKGKKIWVIISEELLFYNTTDLLYEYEKVIVKRDVGMYVERKLYKVIATVNDKIDGTPYIELPTELESVASFLLDTEPINVIHKIYKYFKMEHKTKLKIYPCHNHKAGRLFIDKIIWQ